LINTVAECQYYRHFREQEAFSRRERIMKESRTITLHDVSLKEIYDKIARRSKRGGRGGVSDDLFKRIAWLNNDLWC
jgi:hypothetical protein